MPDYEHLDFIWGINANREVYDVIIDDYHKYRKELEYYFYLLHKHRNWYKNKFGHSLNFMKISQCVNTIIILA